MVQSRSRFGQLHALPIIMVGFALLFMASIAYSSSDFSSTAASAPAEVAAPTSNELLVYSLNRVVTVADRGFPKDDPPKPAANGNWKTPINYHEGTFYYRAEIRSQAVPQNMRLQFCIWQDQFQLENCGKQEDVRGTSGTVVTWEQNVQDLWKLNGRIIEWGRARQRYGIAIKNTAGDPVSNYNGWNWNGENPNAWYPLDIKFTVVVVEKGGTFSGWSNYGGGGGGQPAATPTNTPNQPPNPTPTRTPAPTQTPAPNNTPSANGELITNGTFDNGTSSWGFYSARGGEFAVNGPGRNSSNGATVAIANGSNNIQLYQNGISIKANKTYRLTFDAYANSGHDVQLILHKHTSPYTNLGLSKTVNLGTSWNQHTVEFTTSGFSGTVGDSRLRFWLAEHASGGDVYYFDNVSLTEISGSGTQPPSPTATATDEPPVTGPGGGASGANQIANGSFEQGTQSWNFYTDTAGAFNLIGSAPAGSNAAQIVTEKVGKNIQLFQNGISLAPNTTYRLSFYAYSSSGNDMQVYLHKHGSPYTSYGISELVRLDQSWKKHVIEFTSTGANSTVNDARLRFWLVGSAKAGDKYYIDDVVLERITNATASGTVTKYRIDSMVAPVETQLTIQDSDGSMVTDRENLLGMVFGDANGNGIQELEETGIAGVSVNLLTESGDALAQVVTDEAGYFQIDAVPYASYQAVIAGPEEGADGVKASFTHMENGNIFAIPSSAGAGNESNQIFVPFVTN